MLLESQKKKAFRSSLGVTYTGEFLIAEVGYSGGLLHSKGDPKLAVCATSANAAALLAHRHTLRQPPSLTNLATLSSTAWLGCGLPLAFSVSAHSQSAWSPGEQSRATLFALKPRTCSGNNLTSPTAPRRAHN